MKNHIIVIREMLISEQSDKALEYLSSVSEEFEQQKVFCSTGIIEIDSLINYKLHCACNKGIDIKFEIALPCNINMQTNDFIAVLGNLIDNSIEAADKLSEGKYIGLSIKYAKGNIFINIKNSYNGILNLDGNKFISTKDDKTLHGLGLRSIETIIEKHNGTMEIKYTDNEFQVKIILFSSY